MTAPTWPVTVQPGPVPMASHCVGVGADQGIRLLAGIGQTA